MNFEESLKWSTSQNVVKISCIKEGEDDKFILTVGQYNVAPLVFDTQEEAKNFLEKNFRLTNLDLSIIGAMCQRIYELNTQQFKKEKQ